MRKVTCLFQFFMVCLLAAVSLMSCGSLSEGPGAGITCEPIEPGDKQLVQADKTGIFISNVKMSSLF